MTAARPAQPFTVAALAGFALWTLASLLTTRREAWDAGIYWALVYPLAIAACGLLGYRYPERPWRWALLLFEAQFLAMCLRPGELGNLWPMGMVLFAVIALPGMLAARLAAGISPHAGAGPAP
jgi:hypothetical protein